MLALFAERVRPTPRPLPDEAAQALDALLTRRRQLVEMLTAERHRLLVARAPVRRDLQQHIRFLERRLREADDDLHTAGKASPLWRRGKRLVYGGRAPVRAVFSMAALVASQCHPVIRAFYQRLRAAAKPAKVALTACRRKLLSIRNAIARSGTPWQPAPRLVST